MNMGFRFLILCDMMGRTIGIKSFASRMVTEYTRLGPGTLLVGSTAGGWGMTP